jgi:hypothetical protein
MIGRRLNVMGFTAGLLCLAAVGAKAQLMGAQPYAFQSAAPTFAAQSQIASRNAKAAGAAGQAFLTQYNNTTIGTQNSFIANQTNQNSTSVGNLDQISQILSNGAVGYVTNAAHQDNNGSTLGATTTSSSTVKTPTINATTSLNGPLAISNSPMTTNNSAAGPAPLH